MSDGTTWRANVKSKIAKASIAALAVLAAGGMAAGASDAHEAAATWSRSGSEIVVDSKARISTEAPNAAADGPTRPNAPSSARATWS